VPDVISKCDGYNPPARHHWKECSVDVIKLRSWSFGGKSNWYIATRDTISNEWDIVYARIERDTDRMPGRGEIAFRTKKSTREEAIKYVVNFGRASAGMGFV